MSGRELDKHEQCDADLRKILLMRDAMKAADTQGGEVLRIGSQSLPRVSP